MDNSARQNQNVQPPIPPFPTAQTPPNDLYADNSSTPFFKNKKLIIGVSLAIFFLVVITAGFAIFLNSEDSSKDSPKTQLPTQKPNQVKAPEISSSSSWELQISFDPVSGTYTLYQLHLKDYGTPTDDITSDKPYTLRMLDHQEKELYSTSVSIATRVIVPEILVGTPTGDALASEPVATSVHVPYVEGVKLFQLELEGDVVMNASLPDSVDFTTNDNVLGSTRSNVLQAVTNVSGESPNGWKLSAQPICEDGKAFIEFTYDIPKYQGVIMTHDIPLSHFTTRDSSWQRWSPMILVSGKGKYVATGNLMDWNGSGTFRYNGPVGLDKNHEYMVSLAISGDWNCTGPNPQGCVNSEPPSFEYLDQARVDLTVTTLQCAETTTPVPSPTKSVQCRADPSCKSSKNTLQICPLVCE